MPEIAPEIAGDPTTELPFAHAGPALSGLLRAQADDFQVDELLGYQPTGQGEHAFLRVRKRDLNTADVARTLARFAGVRQVNVGFAGLKDRHAVTTQYFSVHLPGQPDPDWSVLNDPQIQIIQAERHHRKIRRGSLKANRFVLCLRELDGDRAAAESILQRIRQFGVPNYFGPQRFGYAGSNLQHFEKWLAGELKRPKPEQMRMLCSAARSHLFNLILAQRVAAATWDQALPGDVMLLSGSNRQFLNEQNDSEIQRRIAEQDIHPSGLLAGDQGRTLQSQDQAASVEQSILQQPTWQAWVDGLQRHRVSSERRALRVQPEQLSWVWLDHRTLELSFTLPAGAYATTVVRELMATPDRSDLS